MYDRIKKHIRKGRAIQVKEKLITAKQYLAANEVEAIAPLAEQIKQFARSEDGVFDLSALDDNIYAAAGYVYPVYAAYETECNKKEGYPDLLAQMNCLEKRLGENSSLEDTTLFLEMLLSTIDYVSPQLYEYYRELVDMFRRNVKTAIARFYKDGSWENAGNEEAVKRLKKTIAHASDTYVLLGEKYDVYL